MNNQMPAMKSKVLSCRLSPDEADEIASSAVQMSVSVSDVMKLAIREFIRGNDQMKEQGKQTRLQN